MRGRCAGVRRVRRTRTEVISILESALISGGDCDFDDFVSVPIVEPDLEAIRLKCSDVTLAPKNVFEDTLRAALAELRGSTLIDFIKSSASSDPE